MNHAHMACTAAAVSCAIVVATIASHLARLLQQKDGIKQLQNRLMAGLGRRTGEVRGTAIVSGQSPLHPCIASDVSHAQCVCGMYHEPPSLAREGSSQDAVKCCSKTKVLLA